MINLFVYDNVSKQVVINEPDVLLIKEFSDLWTNDRNKTLNDKKGEKKTRAFRELTYIYLAIDWRSPYNQYTSQERHEAAFCGGRPGPFHGGQDPAGTQRLYGGYRI